MVWMGTALSVYLALLFLVYLIQDSMVFPGARWGRNLPVPSVQGVRTDSFALADGSRVRVALGEVPSPRAVLLFFVGNGEDLRSGVQWAGELGGYGVATVVPEYPGYGDSGGRLGVDSFMASAEAAARLAQQRAQELGVPLVVGGTSLGTFSAVHIASLGLAERLLLLAPPTSVSDTGSHHYWWLPVRLLIRHDFDNLGKAGAIRCPTLVLHGGADRTVPVEMGRRVAAALGAEFLIADGHGHTRLPLMPGSQHAGRVRAFLLGE